MSLKCCKHIWQREIYICFLRMRLDTVYVHVGQNVKSCKNSNVFKTTIQKLAMVNNKPTFFVCLFLQT